MSVFQVKHIISDKALDNVSRLNCTQGIRKSHWRERKMEQQRYKGSLLKIHFFADFQITLEFGIFLHENFVKSKK